MNQGLSCKSILRRKEKMVDSKDIIIQFNSNISKDDAKVRVEFYSNIGFFIEIAQMLEFNLRKPICYEKSIKEIEEKEITKENVIAICEKYNKYYFRTYEYKLMLG